MYVIRGATINASDAQILRAYKIRIQEPLRAMSGARKTLDSSMQRSMHFHC